MVKFILHWIEAAELVQCEAGCVMNSLAAPMSLWKTVSLGLRSP